MNELRGKKILIFQQRSWGRGIGYFLAQQLQKEGCELAALTLQKSGHDFLLHCLLYLARQNVVFGRFCSCRSPP